MISLTLNLRLEIAFISSYELFNFLFSSASVGSMMDRTVHVIYIYIYTFISKTNKVSH